MFNDLFRKVANNKNSRFLLERLVDFDEKDKIHIKNKDGKYNIEIIKDNNNYILITLKGTLDNFTDITVYEKLDNDIIFNSLFYLNGDIYFVDSINSTTEISKNNNVIYIKRDNKEYFANHKKDIILKENGKYFSLKLDNGRHKKCLINESSFDEHICHNDEGNSLRKKI